MSQATLSEPNRAKAIEVLEINGVSKKKAKENSIAYFYELQTQMCDAVSTLQKCAGRSKLIKQKIAASEAGKELKRLGSVIKESQKFIDDINSRRDGALGLLKKQGIDVSSELAKMQMLESGDDHE